MDSKLQLFGNLNGGIFSGEESLKLTDGKFSGQSPQI
jgi:hypothetical protein